MAPTMMPSFSSGDILRQPLDIFDHALVVPAPSQDMANIPEGKLRVCRHLPLRNVQEHQLRLQLAQVKLSILGFLLVILLSIYCRHKLIIFKFDSLSTK